jgi:glutamate---cysteine ligase / carboxylate-amine ligase
MNAPGGLHLFEGFGVELEYMVVDRKSLDVRPIADLLFRNCSGSQISDVNNGTIAWSNELTAHVVEVKTNGPTRDLYQASQDFHRNIEVINKILGRHNAMLLPGAAHPWMDPIQEMVLWPHDAHEIYDLYNAIFDCRGHGWANLQSTHLNLPFTGDEEFARLHTAIRLLLPLMPALTASSPILEGRPTGWLDSRLKVYLHNQDHLPILTGRLIPEAVFSEKEYEDRIFAPIMLAISPFDPEGIMDKYFLNSRGAIARFDRGAIEIRILDIQECPLADCSIAQLIVETLRRLATENWSDYALQAQIDTEMLRELFLQVIRSGGKTLVADSGYLRLFGLPAKAIQVSDIWQCLFTKCRAMLDPRSCEPLEQVLLEGCLSARIVRGLQGDYRRENLHDQYLRLADSLQQNSLYLP